MLPPALAGFLLISPRSGKGRPAVDELASAARERGIDVHVLREGDDPAALMRTYAGADALGIAGGDGSLAPAAAVAVERELPFVCVPFGTRNHFARDLGLDPHDPVAALDAFAGDERRVDIGRGGERRFLNNVSLRLYAALLHRREHPRRRPGALAKARALWLSLREQAEVWARLDGDPVRARVLLVANNAYDLRLFTVGERPRLDEGRLHAYTAEGWLPRRWQERGGERFTIDAPGTLEAAVDGEPTHLEPPVELPIQTRTLRGLLPHAPLR